MTKSREVEAIIAVRGFERGVKTLLVEAYERLAALEQMQHEVGSQMLDIARLMEQLAVGSLGLRKEIERMQGREDDDELPPTAS